jgi:hypothetical protein
MHYLPQGDASSPRGRWGICAPALPDVLTFSSENLSCQVTTLVTTGARRRCCCWFFFVVVLLLLVGKKHVYAVVRKLREQE